MNKLLAALTILFLIASAVAAQDWRKDPASANSYNCDLVDALAEQHGSENILKSDSGDVTALSDFLFSLFPECPRWGDVALDDDISNSHIAELVASEAMETIVALYDLVSHEWGEPECSILIDDFYDSGFTVLYGGHAPDGVSIDVYFPDSQQPETMDRVVNDVTASGAPVRIERLYGDEFPLGLYAFDVHVDYETYHFMWNRSKQSMNTVSLSCLDRDLLTSTAPRRDDITSADRVLLEDGEPYEWGEPECSILVRANFEGEFNVIIAGHGQDGLAVDVFVPGAGHALKMDQTYYDVRAVQEIGAAEGYAPFRTEWKWGDFPPGVYEIDVHIDGEVFPFKWQRGDLAFNTIDLLCLDRDIGSDAQRVLQDSEKFLIADTGCTVGNYAWGDEFSAAVFAADQDGVNLEIVFPGESDPRAIGRVDRGELEDGTPYRVKWIAGGGYSKGVHKLLITIGEREFTFEWDRRRREYKSVFVSC